jgi:hypothetical protein
VKLVLSEAEASLTCTVYHYSALIYAIQAMICTANINTLNQMVIFCFLHSFIKTPTAAIGPMGGLANGSNNRRQGFQPLSGFLGFKKLFVPMQHHQNNLVSNL